MRPNHLLSNCTYYILEMLVLVSLKCYEIVLRLTVSYWSFSISRQMPLNIPFIPMITEACPDRDGRVV